MLMILYPFVWRIWGPDTLHMSCWDIKIRILYSQSQGHTQRKLKVPSGILSFTITRRCVSASWGQQKEKYRWLFERTVGGAGEKGRKTGNTMNLDSILSLNYFLCVSKHLIYAIFEISTVQYIIYAKQPKRGTGIDSFSITRWLASEKKTPYWRYYFYNFEERMQGKDMRQRSLF